LNYATVKSLVDEIARECGSHDPFAIAEKSGVAIVEQSWNPITIGEFERKTQTIFINLTALTMTEDADDLRKQIVAHELGHFFAADLRLNKDEEESFARAFAVRLLQAGEN
jgi:Zn-dependent peptidase ImmA (M78 family)